MSARVLHAFYDLEAASPGYHFFNFLVLADIAREELDLDQVHVVFVPGDFDGFGKYLIEIPVLNKQWRLRQICVASTRLLPTCGGHTVCPDRAAAARLINDDATHVFPFGYAIDEPIALVEQKPILHAAAAGHRIDRLRAPDPARAFVRDWLRRHAGDRKAVTISLREAAHDDYRNSNHDSWMALGHELLERGYFPVVVRDTEKVFDGDPADLQGLPEFPLAAVNVEIRAALNAEAHLNAGINQGPMEIWRYVQGVSSFCIYVVDRLSDAWIENWIVDQGWVIGENEPFARRCQVMHWGNDGLAELQREFWNVMTRLEAGEYDDAGTDGGDDWPTLDRLALAKGYQVKGWFHQALALYEKVFGVDPDDHQGRLYVGSACLDAGLFDRALGLLEPLRDVLGPEPWFVDLLARAYLGQRRSADVAALLQPALASHPNDPRILARLGDLHVLRGQPSEAMAAYQQAMQARAPAHEILPKLATACLAAGRADQAVLALVGLLKRGDVSTGTLNTLTRALWEAGLREQASVCFQAASGGEDDALRRVNEALKGYWGQAA